MGMIAELDLRELGFWQTTRNGGFVADYTAGMEAFKKAFHTYTSSNCPVRTGHLLGSLRCENAGPMGLTIYTNCSYAECVEYGTWKQSAQPYFEDAIKMAFDTAYGIWVNAYERALDLEYQFVFMDVYIQAMSNPKANPVFAEAWAHNAATVSVETQRDYLYIDPVPPETTVIETED